MSMGLRGGMCRVGLSLSLFGGGGNYGVEVSFLLVPVLRWEAKLVMLYSPIC